jgi:spermidine synthase
MVKTLWTESFYADVAACLTDRGICVDSDILVPGKAGVRLSRDPCDVSPFDLVRSRRFFAGVECDFTRVPLYPGGWFAFFLYTKDGDSCREPREERRGRYYTPAVHRAAFALPGWWERLLVDLLGTP